MGTSRNASTSSQSRLFSTSNSSLDVSQFTSNFNTLVVGAALQPFNNLLIKLRTDVQMNTYKHIYINIYTYMFKSICQYVFFYVFDKL